MPLSTALPRNQIARSFGVAVKYDQRRRSVVPFLPQRIALIGLGRAGTAHSLDPQPIVSPGQVANLYGAGSPLHLAALRLFPLRPEDGIGSIPVTAYPLAPAAGAEAQTSTITIVGTANAGTFHVYINNIRSAPITLAAGATATAGATAMVRAINAIPHMPVIATSAAAVVTITAKWAGLSSAEVNFRAPSTGGYTSFTVASTEAGTGETDIDVALAKIGSTWETLIVNCEASSSTNLGKYHAWAETRRDAMTIMPTLIYHGRSDSLSDLQTITDTRKNDRNNFLVHAPGTQDLLCTVAASEVAKVARVADENPPVDYGDEELVGLTPGPLSSQLSDVERNTAVTSGISTIEVINGVPYISDVVSMYRPDNEEIPGYRYAVDQMKINNILYNLVLTFKTREWSGAPFIPDNQSTINPAAKKAADATTRLGQLIDLFGAQAWIVNPNRAKDSIRFQQDPDNPKRINGTFSVQLSGNTNVFSFDFFFGFYFGIVQDDVVEEEAAA